MTVKTSSGLLALALVLSFAAAASAQVVREDKDRDLAPTGKGWGEQRAQGQANGVKAARPIRSNGISYHGGPLILGTTNAYFIWYGNWPTGTGTARDILTDLASGIGGTPYFNINTTYYNGAGTHVTDAVSYAASTDNNYSLGTSLTDANIQSIVASAITGGSLAKDTNAVYFVLTSADVNETSGFCTQYCGWHTHGTISGSDVKYAFIGDPSRCPSSCEMQTTGPNGSTGADGMASIIAHELEEAVTDPDLNAWYDQRGRENADKCAWTFGTEYTATNGATANMAFGGRDWLIQRNWVNASGGFCAQSY
jgi:Phosphate-induced protein 1 conserved region